MASRESANPKDRCEFNYELSETEIIPEDLTFSQVVERLAANQPIGGIKDIPLEKSTIKPSESVLNALKKPWE
ncbi:hypothetical protein BB561_005088 [Smittium simulii]|uniref:Peroxisomal membrane protein PEX14-like KPWE domain-containing protein n=1 Tax=Smittium simulii TaxID=133385 RepID=A0A2T9YCC3_9FUNG|nr:hypothetical protein BB561_005088 [Smittium simulii]